MKNEQQKVLNHFLSQIFSGILKIEEKNVESNIFPDLSLRDIHIIETVAHLETTGNNTSTQVALQLHITPGTLSTAVNLLTKKGYLTRKKDSADKRIVRIHITEQGKEAQYKHTIFHENMVEDIVKQLTEEELQVFSRSLQKLAHFFEEKENSIYGGNK